MRLNLIHKAKHLKVILHRCLTATVERYDIINSKFDFLKL